MAPTKEEDLIFSEQANHNFSKTLVQLKEHNLSFSNRFNSIIEDAVFVRKVKAAWQKPLVANERCGSWYIDPASKDGSTYFKSTDGHTGVWKFSTRRLNLHLLTAIGRHDGCIVIDSTRKGKRIPDALSKTIPIWCAVLNRALFPEKIEYHKLFVSSQVISSSEYSQITLLLDGFLKSFLELELDLKQLRNQISKPLRPLWITPETQFDNGALIFNEYHTIICCTASRQILSSESTENNYIQGSADDTENWACGLTPPVFWANRQLLLSTNEADMSETIARLVATSNNAPKAEALSPIAPTSLMHVTNLSTVSSQPPKFGRLIISLNDTISHPEAWRINPTEVIVGLGPHKIGSRNLRTALPNIVSFVGTHLAKCQWKETGGASIIVACSNGRDHSIGVALAVLCVFFDDTGHLTGTSIHVDVNKTLIRRRLSWIMTSIPDANPSRATLQSVNGYLMGHLR